MENIILKNFNNFFKSKEFKKEFRTTLKSAIKFLFNDIYLYIVFIASIILFNFFINIGFVLIFIIYRKKMNKLIQNIEKNNIL